MKRYKTIFLLCTYLLAVTLFANLLYHACQGVSCLDEVSDVLLLDVASYQDTHLGSVWQKLAYRIQVQPFNLFSLLMFICAICHTFFAHKLTALSKKLRNYNIRQGKEIVDSFGVEILHFMGEVEVVFGLWVIPLLMGMAYHYDWEYTIQYLDGRSYVEPMFVVVIMALASTSPIVNLAEDCLRFVARIGKGSAQTWWWAILTIGPLTGSLITEPGAMTISALLLARQFYELNPSPRLAYATLGLLFTNVSVGGVFTSFAAPPVLMVSHVWHWDTPYMMRHFGWKAALGILIANMTYYLIFKKEFKDLEKRRKEHKLVEDLIKEKTIPLWISFVHVAFLAWTVVHSHHPVVFIGSFLLFLGFYQATLPYQKKLALKPPILVGLFLAGLVVHGSLQAWWIAPLLGNVKTEFLLVLSAFLTSFNDNAEITFLASLIPTFDEAMKYAVLAGAVTGGGLTVIANAPNPSGQAILGKYFKDGVSAVNLLFGALFPAIVMAVCFYLLYQV